MQTGQTDPATDAGDRVKQEQIAASDTGGDLSSRLFQQNPRVSRNRKSTHRGI
jgi:hypothetical protein